MRDRHCRWPGCTHTAFTEAHHVEHWARGGRPSIGNLLLLCHHHHQLAHEGGCAIVHDADGAPRFFAPDGALIEAAPAMPCAADALATLTDAPIEVRTSLPRWDGRPLDRHAAVGALAARMDRRAREAQCDAGTPC
jgi:hypothetical protein